jgi:hypothetical protein
MGFKFFEKSFFNVIPSAASNVFQIKIAPNSLESLYNDLFYIFDLSYQNPNCVFIGLQKGIDNQT